jgi:phosphoribosylglycinamide formyltransferase-1
MRRLGRGGNCCWCIAKVITALNEPTLREKRVPDLRLAILVSGRGSVVKTVLAACADGRVAGSVVAVASNLGCPALEVARAGGVPSVGFRPLEDFESRPVRDVSLARLVRDAGANLVIVGGYNDYLEESFFDTVAADVIGMYPALLPAFGELPEAIGPALEYGVKTIGVTVHFRTPLTGSGGPIIAQEPLRVDHTDTVDRVTERVVALESKFLPQVLAAFAQGRIRRDGSRVSVTPLEAS